LPATRHPPRLPGPGSRPAATSPSAAAPERLLQAELDAALDAGLHAPRSATGPVPERARGSPAPASTAAAPPRDIPSLDVDSEVESEVERTRTLLP
jgi:hypothetical protein